MIRATATLSLTALLILVLYLPAVTTPERYLAVLHAEQALTAEAWGPEPAARILAHMLDWQATLQAAAPLPNRTAAPDLQPVHRATAREMAAIHRRIFDSAYFRAIDAALALAAYRFAALLAWLPALAVFLFAVLADGFIVRIVKSSAFRQHDPEVFALHTCGAIVTGCATMVACVVPAPVHPLLWPIAPIAMSVFASRALADYHRRA